MPLQTRWLSTWFWLVLAGSTCLFTVQAETRYQYTGETFTVVAPPNTSSDRITGWFETAVQLPSFSTELDLTGLLTDFQFEDGVQIRTPGNTAVCRFLISTNATGNIVDWRITLRQAGISQGNPQELLDINKGYDQSAIGSAGMTVCALIGLSQTSISFEEGQWQAGLPTGTLTRYVFQGLPYSFAQAPYSTTMSANGWFEIGNPLPQFLPLTDITPSLEGFIFFDGVRTRTLSNSSICLFQVATDGAGHIVDWRLSIRDSSFQPNQPQHTFDTTSTRDLVGTGPAGFEPCSGITLTDFANTTGPGMWTDSQPTGTPTLYQYTGHAFQTADPPYQNTQSVSGFLEFSNPLPGFLANQNLSHALSDFQFFDGIHTFEPANTDICVFQISTDGRGNIIDWSITLRESNIANGALQQSMSISQSGDQVGRGNAGPATCSSITLSTIATNNLSGSWVNPLPPPNTFIYQYSGLPFQNAQDPFTHQQRITGRVSLPGELPPNLVLTDIQTLAGYFQFREGLQFRNQINSQLCSFRLSTNELGQIVEWDISLREKGVLPGGPIELLETLKQGMRATDQVGIGLASSILCGNLNLAQIANTSNSGSWFLLCPTLLANFSQWPANQTILDLLMISCP